MRTHLYTQATVRGLKRGVLSLQWNSYIYNSPNLLVSLKSLHKRLYIIQVKNQLYLLSKLCCKAKEDEYNSSLTIICSPDIHVTVLYQSSEIQKSDWTIKFQSIARLLHFVNRGNEYKSQYKIFKFLLEKQQVLHMRITYITSIFF